MEIILFTGVGIVLYLLCDRLLILLENMHGEPLPGRNVIFFVLILTLSLATFSLMSALLQQPISCFCHGGCCHTVAVVVVVVSSFSQVHSKIFFAGPNPRIP